MALSCLHHQTTMEVKVILNAIEKHSGFTYKSVRWGKKKKSIEVEVTPQGKKTAVCSGCGKRRKVYDRREERRFQYIPLWGFPVFFLYIMRRVLCPQCGVKIEQVPWGSGKRPMTNRFEWFLSKWAKRLSWKEVGEAFGVSSDAVLRSVEMAVEWGRQRMKLSGITSIGIDEIYWKKGHFLTLVYQIDSHAKRLLWVAEHRKEESLSGFFDWIGKRRSNKIKFACTDMWKAYLNVIRERAPNALNILDRFHIVAHMNKAVDEVRAKEMKRLKAKGVGAILTNMKWVLLRRPYNLRKEQKGRLGLLLSMNLRSARAYLLKEDFQHFWNYKTKGWAVKFMKQWCTRAMRSKLDPMKKVARMLRTHEKLILNWFEAKEHIQLGVVEGLNNKAKLTFRKAYGIRSFRNAQTALYHRLGNLPEPKWHHRFC